MELPCAIIKPVPKVIYPILCQKLKSTNILSPSTLQFLQGEQNNAWNPKMKINKRNIHYRSIDVKMHITIKGLTCSQQLHDHTRIQLQFHSTNVCVTIKEFIFMPSKILQGYINFFT